MKRADLRKLKRIAAFVLAMCMLMTCFVFAKNGSETIKFSVGDSQYSAEATSYTSCSELAQNLGSTSIVVIKDGSNFYYWTADKTITIDMVCAIAKATYSSFKGEISFAKTLFEFDEEKNTYVLMPDHSAWSTLYACTEPVLLNPTIFYSVSYAWTGLEDETDSTDLPQCPVDGNNYEEKDTVIRDCKFTEGQKFVGAEGTYVFSGWSDGDTESPVSVGSDGAFNMPARNVQFVGEWVKQTTPTYSISYSWSVSGDDAVTLPEAPVDPKEYKAGDSASVDAGPYTLEGYTFSGWEEEIPDGAEGVTVSDNSFTMPARNVAFKGVWTKDSQESVVYYYQIIDRFTADFVNTEDFTKDIERTKVLSTADQVVSWTNDPQKQDGVEGHDFYYDLAADQPVSGTAVSTDEYDPTQFIVEYKYVEQAPDEPPVDPDIPPEEPTVVYYYQIITHYKATIDGEITNDTEIGAVEKTDKNTVGWDNEGTKIRGDYTYDLNAGESSNGCVEGQTLSSSEGEPTVFNVYYEYTYTTPPEEPEEPVTPPEEEPEEPAPTPGRPRRRVTEDPVVEPEVEPVEEIPEEPAPLAELPAEIVEVPEEEVPLAPAPEEIFEELPEEEVPLADVPTTGEYNNGLLLTAAIASFIAIIGFAMKAAWASKKR